MLLVSEDLDEILELSDRVAVMSGGTISYVSPIDETDPTAFDEEDAWPDTYLALASYLDA